MQKRIIPLLLAAALLICALVSIHSIHGLQGNARVINYAGVVRGATQRLVKQELKGQPNDVLIARLDGILTELATGEGENGLARLEDSTFQDLVGRMQAQWAALKAEIVQVRQGAEGTALYEQSEEYFTLADRTVSAAEAYSERQVQRAEQGLVFLSAVFLLLTAFLAWYSALQDRRQKQLTQAEDENRRKHEHLARMSEDLRAPMDEISEVMYICDLETHELLFLNGKGREAFGITDLKGQKCYRALQGKESPCDFCTTPKLVPGENYTWEFTNPITQRHYLLKDRLLEWEGRPARIEIAFDITEAEAEKQSLKRTLDADLVIFATGFAPNTALARAAGRDLEERTGAILVNEYMQTSDPDIYAGGDCVAIPNLITGKPFVLALGSLANRQGRVIGTNAASDNGKAAAFHGAVGTWCVKIFKMSACGTGLTIERAKAFGFDAISASLEQLDRAHFYPEKHMMTLELVVERGTRRVLGIQGVCEDGDALKARIDAVATMLQFGKPTIDDLANAEIAYAPPFASAMDAVNAVANVADNILSGQLKPISSKEFGELWKDRANNNVFFADARPAVAGNATAAKYPGEWHAIALEDIEAKFDSIPKDRPVALVCNTGLRSYEVMLYLHNHGVTDVVNALGGMQALIKRGDNM